MNPTPQTVAAVDPARREFLRGTLLMPAALGASIGAVAWLSGCSRTPETAQGYQVLRRQDIPMLQRLIPAAMGNAVPTEPAARARAVDAAVHSFDQLLADTSPSIRQALLPLLDLLTMGATRGPLFGLWKSWDTAADADAAAFLDRWAPSSTQFMRGTYNAFVAFSGMAWYLQPDNQGASGYPGPPRKIVIDAA